MIVSFSVSNYRSFHQEETLSLVASKRLESHPGHVSPIPASDQGVLRAAVLYGANGAGKSNLFKALHFMKSLAVRVPSNPVGARRDVFRLSDGSAPTVLDLQFIANGQLYRYGVELDDRFVRGEWLFRLNRGRELRVFERETAESGSVTVRHVWRKDKLRALATVGGPPHQTFLSSVCANLQKPDMDPHLRATADWFAKHLQLIPPGATFSGLPTVLEGDTPFREFAASFLRAGATGLEDLAVEAADFDWQEFERIVPEVVKRLSEQPQSSQESTELLTVDDGVDFHVAAGARRCKRIMVKGVHLNAAGRPVKFPLTEESDGTIRLLNLVPALHRPAVYFIDEIDRSLHPILAREFLSYFLRHSPAESQCLTTTHESGLLDQDLLRRDEIWFAEKDSGGATHLYSLLDFNVRNDLEIRKHYLQGRFGAVPFTAPLENLMPTPEQKA
ncbi:MAG TPA: hypothetical protein DEH78_26270 [Solibacterales bacterium]|nr:hypothetical protein [Bryobacterales bacterium]